MTAPFPRKTLVGLDALKTAGLLTADAAAGLAPVAERYAVAVTPAMADLIDLTDPADPIARQFLPDRRELDRRPEDRDDPIGDMAHSPVEGIVHRYPDRVLLKLLHVCPLYCRFCFRREVVGPEGAGTLSEADEERALSYIRDTPAIWEVILTGGDPFMLSPRRMARVTAALATIGHVRIVRWHTRVPVVAPERVTTALVEALSCAGKTTVVGIHANHPREFTPAAGAALARLVDAGVMLVSQSVLLRGVNDDVGTLKALMRLFLEHRVQPYYLHHTDLAPGTGHFRTSIAEGQALVAALRGNLSGLAQPRYVLDIPGGNGKVPIGPNHVEEHADGLQVTDYRGRPHAYPPGET